MIPDRVGRLGFAVVIALWAMPAWGQSRTTTVILVRHADRADQPAGDPPLTAAGVARARELAVDLRDAGVQAIITTQFTRTKATAEPLARVIGLVPEVIPDTGSRHAHDVARAILEKHAGQTVLVVGHGHTVPAIIAELGAKRPAPICETVFDELYVVTLRVRDAPRVIELRYGAPSPVGVRGGC